MLLLVLLPKTVFHWKGYTPVVFAGIYLYYLTSGKKLTLTFKDGGNPNGSDIHALTKVVTLVSSYLWYQLSTYFTLYEI